MNKKKIAYYISTFIFILKSGVKIMNTSKILAITFSILIVVLFAISMYLMLTKNSETSLNNASSIILYCFSGIPIIIIAGICLIIIAFVFYVLSKILISFSLNQQRSSIALAEALKQDNNHITINTADKKKALSNNNHYLPLEKQSKPSFNGNKGLYEVPKLNLNDYN